MSAIVRFTNIPHATYTKDERTITVENLRWFFDALRKGNIERVVLTNCYCIDCMRHTAKGLRAHDFMLCAFGTMPRGRNGKKMQFEYKTPYASITVFNDLCRKRIERYGVPIRECQTIKR